MSESVGVKMKSVELCLCVCVFVCCVHVITVHGRIGSFAFCVELLPSVSGVRHIRVCLCACARVSVGVWWVCVHVHVVCVHEGMYV